MTPEKNKPVEKLERLRSISVNAPGRKVVEVYINQGLSFEEAVEKALGDWISEVRILDQKISKLSNDVYDLATSIRDGVKKDDLTNRILLEDLNKKQSELMQKSFKLSECLYYWKEQQIL